MTESLLRAAGALGGAGKFAEAAALYRQVLQREPRNFDAIHALGLISYRTGHFQDAERLMSQALAIRPAAAEAHYNLASIRMRSGRFDEALQGLERALRIKPDYIEARGSRAGLLLQMGRHSDSLADCDRLIAIQPQIPQAWAMRACALLAVNRAAESLDSFDRALKLAPRAAALWRDRAFALLTLQRPAEALSSIEQAIAIEPANADLIIKRADLLVALKRHADAIAAYDAALARNPNDSDGWNRRGIALVETGQKPQALESFDEAIRHDPAHLEARSNRANILFELKRFAEAAHEYEQVVRAAPDTPYAEGFLIQSRLRICDWRSLEADRQRLSTAIRNNRRAIDPQGYLAICADAEEQLRCARIYLQDETAPLPPPQRRTCEANSRIRVAYVSADFRPHPVAFLIAGVFEHHDRHEFDLTGVALGPPVKSKIRDRITGAFEHFFNGSSHTDQEIAAKLSQMQIDIAVDLTGFTDGCRPGILLRRPAPIQVNFLGFPGTMGSPHIDYILADRFLIPEQDQRFYSEKVVYLPNTYQANDDRREVADRIFTRRDAGLPANGFVFCCFNNNYKITPDMFDIWMRLLRSIPDAVLWLLQDNEDAANNLRREAASREVAAERLIFAPRIAPAEHIARQHLADLFLDTSPYSAHTTCSDALFVGLPVVSFYGPTFPARVAVSLLHAAGVGELATDSLESYYARALHLAQNREELNTLRARLTGNRNQHPLFDTARFTRGLERAYRQMVTLYREGQPPRSFAVESGP